MNPCPKCQSFGKCSGTCWVLDLAEQSKRIDAEMQTPEFKALIENTIPYISLIRGNSSDRELYWRKKRIDEMF